MGVSALKINSYMSNSQNMLHGTCGELPGGARLGGPSHALYKPGAALVGPSAGQGCAQEDDAEKDARCWSSPGRQGGSLGSVAFQPLGLGARQRSRRRDTWEERADASVLPLKPEFGVQAWWQSPRRQCGGPAGPGEPRARQWHPHESWCGGTVPVPSVQQELPKELLLRWLNLLAGKPGTLRLSNP